MTGRLDFPLDPKAAVAVDDHPCDGTRVLDGREQYVDPGVVGRTLRNLKRVSVHYSLDVGDRRQNGVELSQPLAPA